MELSGESWNRLLLKLVPSSVGSPRRSGTPGPGARPGPRDPEEPQAVSIGIERVWVNGVEVYRDGDVTGERPGVVLRRAVEGVEGEKHQ